MKTQNAKRKTQIFQKICLAFTNAFSSHKGQSIVELLLTMGLAAILMPAFLIGFSATRQGRAQQVERLKAIAYLRQNVEAVRIIRDNGWASLPVNGTYYASPSATTWVLASGVGTPSAGFTSSIVLGDVYRNNTTHAIDPAGSSSSTTLDPSTKSFTVTISWSTPISSSVSEVLYLTRHDNLSFLDTSTTDFGAGDTSGGTVVTNLRGGEIQIGGGGSNDWCAPATPITFTTSSNHNEYSISAFASTGAGVNSYAYTTFGDSANGHVLDKWNVSNPAPTQPPTNPTISSGGNYNPNGEKGYGLYATSSAVFVTSNKNGVTVDIVDPSTLTQSATFNASGGEKGRNVYMANTDSGNEGFVTTCNVSGTSCSGGYKLYSFDYHTSPLTGARTQNGTANLTAEGKRIVIVGKIAFVAENSTSTQLEIFDVRNPSSMQKINFSYSGGSIASKQATPQGATDIYVDASGKFAYLVTSYDTQADIFYLNLNNLTYTGGTISIDGWQTTSVSGGGTMSPTGVTAVSQNHLIVVGSGGNQYQVFYTPSLSRCISGNNGMINIGSNVKGVSGVSESDGDNFAYILTDDANKEFQIIPGGEGAGGSGGGNGTIGTFISQPIPVPTLATPATFNSFFPIADTPGSSSIKYQVATAATCAGPFAFVGTNGDPTLYFATSSAIPLSSTAANYANPGKCFKYKAILDSGGSTTASPILYQTTINYSP